MPAPNAISSDKLARIVGTPRAPGIIDVRSDEDHAIDPRLLPGAIRADDRDRTALAALPPGPVVVLCQAGHRRSQGAAAWLRAAGRPAEYLDGGFAAWRDAGLPTQKRGKRANGSARSDKTHTHALRSNRFAPDDERRCGCGVMHRIGEDRSERLDIVPAQLRVIVTVRPKYACRTCTDGVTQAPAPSHLIMSGLPTEASIAHVLVSRYADHLPLYRQSQILARAGLDLHRAVLADWVGKAAFHLKPVVDRLADHLKRSGKLFMDETTAPVLDPGRGKTKTGYLWALARDDRPWGGEDPPGVVYFYAPGRAGENAETFLAGFDGILQIDGYTGYNRLTKPSRKGGAPVRVAHCWAHARRKLKEVFDRDGSEIAAEGLRRIAEFYAVEADIRSVSPGQRLSARQARTAPLVAAFGDWLQAQRRKISAKSRLGEKLTYIHNHWDGLQTFLTDGRVEIDTNRVENLIRPIALSRKNSLFAGHDEGGIAWGRIASLIETCKINGIEPFAYLRATLTAIATGHPQNRLDDLLPWNFKPSS